MMVLLFVVFVTLFVLSVYSLKVADCMVVAVFQNQIWEM